LTCDRNSVHWVILQINLQPIHFLELIESVGRFWQVVNAIYVAVEGPQMCSVVIQTSH
jgi:hypothetical protein